MTGDSTLYVSPVPPAPAKRKFGWSTLLLVALSSAGIAVAAARLATRSDSADEAAAPASAAATIYQCPMHPSIRQDHPGECPICGMKLVKVEKAKAEDRAQDAAATKAGTGGAPSVAGLASVEIDEAKQQLIGLKTTEVMRGPVGGAWRTVGRVAIDETRVRHINLKVPGFVEHIYVDFIGKKVKRGDPLFSIYSPELLSAQEEYLLAIRTKGVLSTSGGLAAGNGEDLVAAARRKLSLWDVPQAEIERVARTGEAKKTLTLYSPIAGVVTKKDVVEGMKLDAGAMPLEIVDLSAVWVLADVYESELRFVKEQMAATLELAAFPNRVFRGNVMFVDPLMDPQTRTVKVRLTFPNPVGELRPEMFGEVVLSGSPHDALRVPLDAIVDSGTEKVVFVAIGEGKFQPRRVMLGESDAAQVEVVSGLVQGERVVIRANFLVDSESRLRASLAETPTAAGSAKAPESARVLPDAAVQATPAVDEHREHRR